MKRTGQALNLLNISCTIIKILTIFKKFKHLKILVIYCELNDMHI